MKRSSWARSVVLCLPLATATLPACTTPLAPVDAPVTADVPTATDVPVATDAPVEVDAPTASDAPPVRDAPLASDTPPGTDSGPAGTATFGEACTADAECASGVCWDFSDIDPFCFGRGCSLACTSDAECQAAAAAAGSTTPGAATCTPATGTCDLSGTGLVPIACA